MEASGYEGVYKYARDTRYIHGMLFLVVAVALIALFAMVLSESGRTDKALAQIKELKGIGTTPLPRSCEDAEAKLKSQERIIGDQRGYIADLIGRIQELEHPSPTR